RCRGFDGRFRSLVDFRTRPADVLAFLGSRRGRAGCSSGIWCSAEGRGVPAEPSIVVQALTYAYPGGPPALAGVSFCVAAGESIGLVGPNGAGKTTLFLALSGVLSLKPGMARLAGLDPSLAADRRRLPERVGIVFQNSDDQIFNATVFDDVA